VIAGAAIGIASSYLFTRLKGWNVQVEGDSNTTGSGLQLVVNAVLRMPFVPKRKTALTMKRGRPWSCSCTRQGIGDELEDKKLDAGPMAVIAIEARPALGCFCQRKSR